MIALTLAEVAAAVAGRLAGADPATLVTGSVEFDSRKVDPGGLFVAFPGEKADGHDFAAAAVAAGAVAVARHPRGRRRADGRRRRPAAGDGGARPRRRRPAARR